jgi:hypothetical protein
MLQSLHIFLRNVNVFLQLVHVLLLVGLPSACSGSWRREKMRQELSKAPGAEVEVNSHNSLRQMQRPLACLLEAQASALLVPPPARLEQVADPPWAAQASLVASPVALPVALPVAWPVAWSVVWPAVWQVALSLARKVALSLAWRVALRLAWPVVHMASPVASLAGAAAAACSAVAGRLPGLVLPGATVQAGRLQLRRLPCARPPWPLPVLVPAEECCDRRRYHRHRHRSAGKNIDIVTFLSCFFLSSLLSSSLVSPAPSALAWALGHALASRRALPTGPSYSVKARCRSLANE